MRISEQDKRTFEKIVDFMEHIDRNGSFYTILEELNQNTIKELATEILEIFRRWKADIGSESDPKYKAICNFEMELIAII